MIAENHRATVRQMTTESGTFKGMRMQLNVPMEWSVFSAKADEDAKRWQLDPIM